ncbi:MAG: winged helix-turn-helix domain-containing protein [Candidatus Acidiferrum sp.]|jgi:DNA-binding winged helix-turn-helix (wHTH) protein
MYRFGPFEFDLRSHELRRDYARLKIPEQCFTVLRKLVEHPGELVTRDELRKAVWPAETFVDFDTGLNKIVKLLRQVLGDSADAPSYIETVPKLGYRFVAPLLVVESPREATSEPPPRSFDGGAASSPSPAPIPKSSGSAASPASKTTPIFHRMGLKSPSGSSTRAKTPEFTLR